MNYHDIQLHPDAIETPGISDLRFSNEFSPDMDSGDIIRLEASWKERLHTRAPHGLNDN